MKTGLLGLKTKIRAKSYRSNVKGYRRFIKGVEHTVKNNGKSAQMLEAEEVERRRLRKKEEEEQALMNSLFGAVNNLKNAAGDESE